MRPYAVRGWRNREKQGRRFWTAVRSMVYKRDDEAGGIVRGSTVKRNVGLSRNIFLISFSGGVSLGEARMVEGQKQRKANYGKVSIHRYPRIEMKKPKT